MRGIFAGAGCTLTFLCWITAALLSLGWMMGDCMGGSEQGCPTDHQRNMAVLKIVLGAALLNIAGLLVMGYFYARRNRP